jgi:hypothetical protein
MFLTEGMSRGCDIPHHCLLIRQWSLLVTTPVQLLKHRTTKPKRVSVAHIYSCQMRSNDGITSNIMLEITPLSTSRDGQATLAASAAKGEN